MSDTNQFSATQAGTMSPEDYAQQQALNRQQRFAELLMAQGTQGQPAGQMVSGRYVPNSFFQNLLPAAQMMTGAYIGKQSDTKAAELAQKLRTQGNEDIYNVMTNLNGRPAQPSQELAGPAYQGVAPSIQYPAVAPNPQAALQTALQSQSPQVKALIPALVQNQIPKKTDEMLNFEAAKADGFKGSFTDYKNKMNDYQKEELKISAGRLAVDQAKAAFEMQNGKPLTETQGKAASFGGSALEGNNIMTALEAKGFDPSTFYNQSQITAARTGMIGNKYASSEAQQYQNAMDLFGNNYLRYQSGANMPPKEIQENLALMTPRMGDSKEKLAQKANARLVAIRGMESSAGPSGTKQMYQNTTQGQKGLPSTASTINPVVAPTAKPIYATNGKIRIMSTDGGNTWQPAGGQ